MSDNDISPDHFEWLTDGRSKNQKSTVNLYRIIRSNEAKLNRFTDLQVTAQALSSVAFSLWRAVFLSDVSDDVERHTADLSKFLVSLIADNTVLYRTDKNSRNWSFRYYLENAEFRLERISDDSEDVAKLVRRAASSEKERWLNTQAALDVAIERFGLAVDRAPQVSS